MAADHRIPFYLSRDSQADFGRKLLGKANCDRILHGDVFRSSIYLIDVFQTADRVNAAAKQQAAAEEELASGPDSVHLTELERNEREMALINEREESERAQLQLHFQQQQQLQQQLLQHMQAASTATSSEPSTSAPTSKEDHLLSLDLVHNSSFSSTTPTDTTSSPFAQNFGSTDSYEREFFPPTGPLTRDLSGASANSSHGPASTTSSRSNGRNNPLVVKRNPNIERMITEVAAQRSVGAATTIAAAHVNNGSHNSSHNTSHNNLYLSSSSHSSRTHSPKVPSESALLSGSVGGGRFPFVISPPPYSNSSSEKSLTGGQSPPFPPTYSHHSFHHNPHTHSYAQHHLHHHRSSFPFDTNQQQQRILQAQMQLAISSVQLTEKPTVNATISISNGVGSNNSTPTISPSAASVAERIEKCPPRFTTYYPARATLPTTVAAVNSSANAATSATPSMINTGTHVPAGALNPKSPPSQVQVVQAMTRAERVRWHQDMSRRLHQVVSFYFYY